MFYSEEERWQRYSRRVQAAAILRLLPGLAERLQSSSPPPSCEDLRQLRTQLGALKPMIENGTAALPLLCNAGLWTSLLSILAVALRQPLDSSAGAQRSGAAAGSGAELSQLYTEVATSASACCQALVAYYPPRALVKRHSCFALRLVRTQALQCCARRLAAVRASLLPLQEDLQLLEDEAWGRPRGRAASSRAAPAQQRQEGTRLVVREAVAALSLIHGLLVCAWPHKEWYYWPPHSELEQLRRELVPALRDSCVLEHAARAVLLLPPPSRRRHPSDDNDADFAHVVEELSSAISFLVPLASFRVPLDGDEPVPAATRERADLAAVLRGLLSGRCVQHAVRVLGVAALCSSDGGPAYGLPSELLRRVPVLGRRLGPAGEAVGDLLDVRQQSGRVALDPRALKHMLHVMRCKAVDAPSGRHSVLLALALRVCRLVVASGRAQLGEGAGTSEAESTAARRECGGGGSVTHASGGSGSGDGSGNGGGGSSGSGGDGGGGSRGGGRTSGGCDGRRREAADRPTLGPDSHVVLLPRELLPLWEVALEAAMGLCFPARLGERPERAATRVRCWRLFAACVRDVLPLLQGWHSCSPLGYLQDPGPLVPGAPLPASPPPSWEDALAGGWLPCLERLLCHIGQGPEARHADFSLAVPFTDVSRWRHLAVLLAYGERRQAAALVATLGKLLRASKPVTITGDFERDLFAGHLGIADVAYQALMEAAKEEEQEDAGAAAAPGAEEAEGGAQGGLPGGEQSAAGRQLALMLSCALCEWLPALARLAKRAMVAAELCVPAGPRHHARAAATAAALLPPLYAWLPVLAQRCSMAAAGGAAADGGAAGAAGGPGADGGGGGAAHVGSSGGGWRQLLLEEVGAVPLLGAALGLLTGARKAAAADEYLRLWRCRMLPEGLVRACCAVAIACPDEVRASVASGAEGAQPRFSWRPQQLRVLAGVLVADGRGPEADGAEALAALLEVWAAGGGEDEGEAAASQAAAEVGAAAGAETGAEAESGAGAGRPSALCAAWRRVGACCALLGDMQRRASALVPVVEARGVF